MKEKPLAWDPVHTATGTCRAALCLQQQRYAHIGVYANPHVCVHAHGKEGKRRLRVDGRKRFLTVRVVRHWYRLPGEVMPPAWSCSRPGWGWAVSNVGWWEVPLPTAGGWNEVV